MDATASALLAAGLLAALALGVARTATALRRRRRRRAGRPANAIARSPLRRGLRMGKLGATSATRTAFARLRSLGASEAHRREALERAHRANAERVLQTMGELKGALMKLGQMASYVSDAVPAPMREALAQLHSAAPAFDFAALRVELERELGAPIDTLFASVDPEPLAAASIGQVHRGALHDGSPVAIKIQYPGVDEAIGADLAQVGWLTSWVGALYPNLEPEPLVTELRDRLREELDYETEARNLRLFGELYESHPWIAIPAAHEALSTRRVLTMDLARGSDFESLRAAPSETRQRAAEILYRFVWGSLFCHRAFNGDPHPGNYLFGDDGRVTFLDFGCVKYFSKATAQGMCHLHEHHFAGDLHAYRAQLVSLGFIDEHAPIPAELYAEYMSHFYRPFLRDEVYRFDREYTSRSLAHVLDRNDERYGEIPRHSNMPPDMVFLNRLQWGLWPLLADLDARANWHRIHREYIFGDAPSTPLGAEAAAWAADWRRKREIPENAEVWLESDGLRHGPPRREAAQ